MVDDSVPESSVSAETIEKNTPSSPSLNSSRRRVHSRSPTPAFHPYTNASGKVTKAKVTRDQQTRQSKK
ncbi:hypothetical protein PHYBLDRAFT_77026 [Phycomyces blakesleeanus NRRL 1555(-)]|uniref:Uncharacterized protein n=2 Tax=Phycomyces blakesleeanus TaxID=4837 RepID=A0A167PYF4_PHYB8|nr:hypothetical protein PHYBLDRAFT_77026 [Phycomyces blakesleeanus NRRL 1555(-)]OAD78769.1 hypothetical protein PHYBLDRAFT_77026 [Phycomyces blakesleeanus NRRL 1555(-)]|eukprot:XP_018296809.1 hypothetical protein PHYBLDRAFT_77026 [Phycomyces blakesleeanus NRRL 1555(-)]